ncbi:hypothetical protein J437_LFUL004791 [Ladona fulva]|uniref:Uncharacterized protein n=1 Tax=Ladona fulva TaxID=123851 RepID=A0A8K0NXP6_LADFU|nr:hypothetical protein J437_LFUL004791 [Ladona fulva]
MVRSTYWEDDEEKPASFWFNPFPKSKKRNEGTGSQSPQRWDESMGDVLCLRVLRQLSSLGIPHGRLSLAKIMLQAFQRYKKGIYRIHEIRGSKIQEKDLTKDDPENLKMESKILKEKMWLDNSKTFVWNADIEESFIAGLLNKSDEVTPVRHNLVRNEEKRLKKLQSLREAAKKEQEDWVKLREHVILPYHTLYAEQ